MKPPCSEKGWPNSFLNHRPETTKLLQKIGEGFFFPNSVSHASPHFPGRAIFMWTQTALPMPHPSPPPGSWRVVGKLQKAKDQPQLGRSLLSIAASLFKKFACRFWMLRSSGQLLNVLIHLLKSTQACTPHIAEQAHSLTEPAIHRVQREPAFPSISTHIWTQLELEHPRVETLPC